MSPTQPAGALPPSPDVEARLLAFLDRTTDLVGVTDDQGNIVYLNDTARSRLPAPSEPGGHLTTVDIFPPEVFDTYFEQMRPALLRGDVWNGVLPVLAEGGDPVDMWVTVVGGVRPGGEVAWLALTARDVTGAHHRHDPGRGATHDVLTGLANRTLLNDRMAIALARAQRTGAEVAVLFVDVDDLKVVNDSFGHHAGDAVLVELASRLNDSVRAIDTVARVGGDEFVVLLDGVDDEEEARSLATRVQAVLESRAVEAAPGIQVNVSASVGMACGGADVDGETLLRRADAAMYELKGERHPERRFPMPGVHDLVPALNAHDVAIALTQRAIVPYYQPVIVAGTGDVAALHVLARWLRHDGEPIAAQDFIDIVEGSGVSFSLDLAMLRQAVSDLASWPELGVARVDVPVAARFLLRPGVSRFVHEVLSQAHLPADHLAVVVPERLLAHHSRLIADALWSLHEEGILLVASVPELEPGSLPQLDDGLFAELRFPAAADLDALVAFARERGMAARAFGVETSATLARVAAAGCDLAEGRALGLPRPMPERHTPFDRASAG